MASRSQKESAQVGVADHAGWAVLVTVGGDGNFIDRRRVELVDAALPTMPHHHDCQALGMAEAVALVERVARSANACADECLAALAASVPVKISTLALRVCPPLPDTVAERITNYRAQCVADWVMYREALARAAKAMGWFVHWYDARRVPADAARTLRRATIEDLLEKTGKAIGPPWQKDHRMAMAAAIAAGVRSK